MAVIQNKYETKHDLSNKFLITILSMGMWIFIYVGFFEVLFLKIDNLAGWEKDEILIFLAFIIYFKASGIFYTEKALKILVIK